MIGLLSATFFTAVKFCSQGNMGLPRFWTNPDVSCYNWFM